MNELPTVSGLMICETVITDLQTRNSSVINRFTTLKLKQFPTPPRRMSIFAALTDGFGRILRSLEIEPLDGGDTIYRFSAPIDFPDRLREVRFVLHIPDLSFPRPGAYQAALYAGQEPLARTVFQVVQEGGSM